jgi:vacuolar-type H+-ATPase subunit I/STV1
MPPGRINSIMKKILKEYAWIFGLSLGILLISILTFPGPEKKRDFLQNAIDNIQKQKEILTTKEYELLLKAYDKEWQDLDKAQNDNN